MRAALGLTSEAYLVSANTICGFKSVLYSV
jgi:hypothetical protein